MFGSKKENNNIPKGTASSAHNSLVFGTTIIGNLTSKTDIRIDGKLEGNLESEAKVVIGKNALIIGDIHCDSILIEGKVEGNITTKDKLHIQGSGVVEGNLITNKLIIEDGAIFNGASIMGKNPLGQRTNGQSGRKSTTGSNKEVQKAS